MKKKIYKIVIATVICFCLVGCTGDTTTISKIEFSEFKEKVEQKESFILEVIQTGCTHCEEFSPRLKKILARHHLTAYSLNLSNLSAEEKKELKDISYVSGTPTVIFFTKGEEESSHKIIGTVSDATVIRHLKELEYIKQ